MYVNIQDLTIPEKGRILGATYKKPREQVPGVFYILASKTVFDY